MKKIIIFFIFIILTVSAYIFLVNNNQNEFDLLNSHLKQNGYILQKDMSFSGEKVVEYQYVKNGEILMIKKSNDVSRSVATKKITYSKLQLKSLYDPKPSPYFAVITQQIVCPDKFKMKIKFEKDLNFRYSLFATKQQIFGVCNENSIFYKVELFTQYYKDQKVLISFTHYIPYKQESSLSLEYLEKLVFNTGSTQ